MAFSNLMLTTDGRILLAKAQQGKMLKLTRVGLGDGLIGSGSMVNRTVLINQTMTLLIDAVQLTNNATEAAVVSTLSNKDLSTGFYFRELGIFAEDPDTHQEKLYLYDNAGSDGEFIPDNTSNVTVYERIKMLITVSDVADITFVESGNPLYLTVEDLTLHNEDKHAHPTKADLDENGKILESQMPGGLDIDGGIWDVTEVQAHNASVRSHPNLLLDGNENALPVTGDELAEHEVNPMAHGNIYLDGNGG